VPRAGLRHRLRVPDLVIEHRRRQRYDGADDPGHPAPVRLAGFSRCRLGGLFQHATLQLAPRALVVLAGDDAALEVGVQLRLLVAEDARFVWRRVGPLSSTRRLSNGGRTHAERAAIIAALWR
jgi:hypothetical protein